MKIKDLIYGPDYNIYEGFEFKPDNFDIGGGVHKETWQKLISRNPNKEDYKVLEIGSWFGGSAIKISRILEEMGYNHEIICVDTWFGSLYHVTEPGWLAQLNLKNGRANIYDRFLQNIVNYNCTKTVVPYSQTSLAACERFISSGLKFDAIFIDGDHSSNNVMIDLVNSLALIKVGGTIVADDYHFDTVYPVIDKILGDLGVKFEVSEGRAIINL